MLISQKDIIGFSFLDQSPPIMYRFAPKMAEVCSFNAYQPLYYIHGEDCLK